MVDEHLPIQMVKLMLHHAGKVAPYPFIMVVEVLIVPCHMNTRGTNHLLMDGWKRQATLLRRVCIRLIVLNDMRVDKNLSESFVFRKIVRDHIKVNDRQTDSLAYLRGSKSDALRFCQRVPHIGNQFLQLRIIGSNIIGHLSQHRLTININR